ncbi:hypothetical protein AU196_01295 [Mycobacterium sp. IS-1742]|uniref:hypothetical protein n=1 Tax=Mycobacterium sp. IS-1742 TaxID=1772285 RepID=UPI000740554B|nr:hypothetical protein [Mycobacterium sp. IS-1742]KUI27200.1 hypothetical protein AU196_01295 [Mycobacterium sp. IS-1742]
MVGRLSLVLGAVLFAGGAIGAAVWLWVKRRQLAVAAAKAVPEQTTAAAADQTSKVVGAVPGQVDAVRRQQPPSVL